MADPAGQVRDGVLRLDVGSGRPRAWLVRHLQGALWALGHMSRAPLASLMTCAVIGIALALPAALFVALGNLSQLGSDWQRSAQISVFLAADARAGMAEQLAAELRLRSDVAGARTVSPEQALAEYRAMAGDSAALQSLDGQNPLPWLVVVVMEDAYTQPEEVEALATELRRVAGVDQVEYDQRWLRRLAALVALARRVAQVLAAGLGLGVLLVVGNTVRLEIERRRNEIQVLRLVGGTDAFVRRPFLYAGLWYGLFGAAMAALLVVAALLAVREPVDALSAAYGGGFALRWPGATQAGQLVASGALLGLLGAWLAVARYLRGAEDTSGQDG